jgi:hypothetical protein
MRKPARLDSARTWIRFGARVTVRAHAKHYGVDRYTAYEDLSAIGARCLPARSNGQRPPAVSRKRRRRTDEFDDVDHEWIWVDSRRMFAVDYTAGGAPFGCYEDEFEDWP